MQEKKNSRESRVAARRKEKLGHTQLCWYVYHWWIELANAWTVALFEVPEPDRWDGEGCGGFFVCCLTSSRGQQTFFIKFLPAANFSVLELGDDSAKRDSCNIFWLIFAWGTPLLANIQPRNKFRSSSNTIKECVVFFCKSSKQLRN